MIVAQDGVHPNEVGYQAFADFLGQEIAVLLKRRIELRAGKNGLKHLLSGGGGGGGAGFDCEPAVSPSLSPSLSPGGAGRE